MKRPLLSVACTTALLMPLPAFSVDQATLVKEIASLSKQLDELKKQMQALQQEQSAKDDRFATVEQKAQETEQKVQTVVKKEAAAEKKASNLEISGDYRFRFDRMAGSAPSYYQVTGATTASLMPAQDYRNNSLLTNRFGLNVKAKATEDFTVKARLLMYKGWGEETYTASPFFSDKFYSFDGNVGHIPKDDILRIDQAYATWSAIGGAPVWFSVGRRPSTGGIPTNLRQNIAKDVSDTAGVPGLLVDYAFDGATLGIAPDIEKLPGAYAKFCYGRGFDSGFTSTSNQLKDVHFVGVNMVPYATDNLRVELQWDRGSNIFAFPETATMNTVIPGSTFTNNNLGNIDQYMIGASGKINNVGSGTLNLFLSAAISKSHPNSNLMGINGTGVAGLMYNCTPMGCAPQNKTGNAIYLGGRYDVESIGTKFGLEYNHGSKNWIAFAPASDDMWTAKQGVHGNVYEAYLIHEINSKPLSKFGKAQFRLGYQYYDFQYTGSNNWVGAPVGMDALNNPLNAQMLTPLKNASDVYLTFDVAF